MKFYYAQEGIIDLVIRDDVPLVGNILIQFKAIGKLTTSNLFRISFNTAFIDRSNKIVVDKTLISPESLHNSSVFADDFEMTLTFQDYCVDEKNPKTGEIIKYACRSHSTPIENLCKNCKVMMSEEIENWKLATEILEKHDKPTI